MKMATELAKHPRNSWTIESPMGWPKIYTSTGVVIVAGGYSMREMADDPAKPIEIMAVTHLCGAAPDMYEALKEAQEQLRKLGVRMGHIESALDKAEGK
jgi:hypothetical protein